MINEISKNDLISNPSENYQEPTVTLYSAVMKTKCLQYVKY